jgi:hypothetical protein
MIAKKLALPGWKPVLGKDHAQTKTWTVIAIQLAPFMV